MGSPESPISSDRKMIGCQEITVTFEVLPETFEKVKAGAESALFKKPTYYEILRSDTGPTIKAMILFRGKAEEIRRAYKIWDELLEYHVKNPNAPSYYKGGNTGNNGLRANLAAPAKDSPKSTSPVSPRSPALQSISPQPQQSTLSESTNTGYGLYSEIANSNTQNVHQTYPDTQPSPLYYNDASADRRSAGPGPIKSCSATTSPRRIKPMPRSRLTSSNNAQQPSLCHSGRGLTPSHHATIGWTRQVEKHRFQHTSNLPNRGFNSGNGLCQPTLRLAFGENAPVYEPSREIRHTEFVPESSHEQSTIDPIDSDSANRDYVCDPYQIKSRRSTGSRSSIGSGKRKFPYPVYENEQNYVRDAKQTNFGDDESERSLLRPPQLPPVESLRSSLGHEKRRKPFSRYGAGSNDGGFMSTDNPSCEEVEVEEVNCSLENSDEELEEGEIREYAAPESRMRSYNPQGREPRCIESDNHSLEEGEIREDLPQEGCESWSKSESYPLPRNAHSSSSSDRTLQTEEISEHDIPPEVSMDETQEYKHLGDNYSSEEESEVGVPLEIESGDGFIHCDFHSNRETKPLLSGEIREDDDEATRTSSSQNQLIQPMSLQRGWFRCIRCHIARPEELASHSSGADDICCYCDEHRNPSRKPTSDNGPQNPRDFRPGNFARLVEEDKYRQSSPLQSLPNSPVPSVVKGWAIHRPSSQLSPLPPYPNSTPLLPIPQSQDLERGGIQDTDQERETRQQMMKFAVENGTSNEEDRASYDELDQEEYLKRKKEFCGGEDDEEGY